MLAPVASAISSGVIIDPSCYAIISLLKLSYFFILQIPVIDGCLNVEYILEVPNFLFYKLAINLQYVYKIRILLGKYYYKHLLAIIFVLE